MPGQYGSNSYTIYRKELEKVVDQLRHEKMMEIDPQYAQQFAKLTAKEASRGDRLLALKQMQKRLKAQGFDKPQSIGKIQFKKNHGNRDKMIISCLPMVVSVAKKILWNSKSSVQFDDLIQSGNLGLVIAADNYLNTAFPDRKSVV